MRTEPFFSSKLIQRVSVSPNGNSELIVEVYYYVVHGRHQFGTVLSCFHIFLPLIKINVWFHAY